jgi:sulfur carrier protein
MKARVNGTERELPDGTTVAALLQDLGVTPTGLAVAVNERVVRGNLHDATTLTDGDAVEIIRAVAGGY